MLSIFKKYKTGIALSGGGARGFAHLGVLQALNEHGIIPSVISGASAGSLVGAFYADGYEPYEIMDFFSIRKVYQLMRLVLRRTGFVRINGLEDILRNNLRAKNIEDLKTPLIIAATNFNLGKIEYLEKGNLIKALLSSSSIPILFEAQQLNEQYYLDGGIMDNLPIRPLINNCRNVIAVHVNPIGTIDRITSPLQVGERAFHLAIASEIHSKIEKVDMFIEPASLTDYGMLDMKKSKEIFEVGYTYTKDYLAQKS